MNQCFTLDTFLCGATRITSLTSVINLYPYIQKKKKKRDIKSPFLVDVISLCNRTRKRCTIIVVTIKNNLTITEIRRI